MKKILDGIEAYGMVKKIFHYTNHTIMTEAMECWDENMFRLLLPRIYQIICAINEKYCQKLSVYYSKEEEKIAQMAVIGNNEIRMAKPMRSSLPQDQWCFKSSR